MVHLIKHNWINRCCKNGSSKVNNITSQYYLKNSWKWALSLEEYCTQTKQGQHLRPKSWRYIIRKVKCDGLMDGRTSWPTDGRTDGRTDKAGGRVACTRLKIHNNQLGPISKGCQNSFKCDQSGAGSSIRLGTVPFLTSCRFFRWEHFYFSDSIKLLNCIHFEYFCLLSANMSKKQPQNDFLLSICVCYQSQTVCICYHSQTTQLLCKYCIKWNSYWVFVISDYAKKTASKWFFKSICICYQPVTNYLTTLQIFHYMEFILSICACYHRLCPRDILEMISHNHLCLLSATYG